MDCRREKTSLTRSLTATITAASLIAAAPALAQERERSLEMNIIGNNETPHTLIIVPWKSAEPGELALRPLQSLVDARLGPLDRDVHRREMRWRNAQRQNP